MDWSTRRKVGIIAVITLLALIVIGWFVYVHFFRKEETCKDGIQNQNERGVDCGGVCYQFCAADMRVLVPAWARFLPINKGEGSVVAVIENRNQTALAAKVNYEIRLYDEKNLLVTDAIRGTTSVEPNGRTAVFVPRVSVGERTVSHVFISFSGAPLWVSTDPASPRNDLSTSAITIDPDPFLRVSAQLSNRGAKQLTDVRVIAIASDAEGNAVAASETTVDAVPAFGTANLAFTWPPSVQVSIARIDFIPSVPAAQYVQVPTER